MIKITKTWMIKKYACDDAVKAWEEKGCESDPIKIIDLAMKMNRFDWANWFIVRVMNYRQYVSYSIFAAEQVIYIYEAKYPADKRPQIAIAAARQCLIDPSKKNKDAAAAAYAAADAAAAASYAAYAAAHTAAAYAAYAAAAADAAADKKDMRVKIINYGISLLKEAIYE
jgi:hypothetical protein